ncbi:MAG: thioredoxin family protein [Ilumatobacteraceae bacterium]
MNDLLGVVVAALAAVAVAAVVRSRRRDDAPTQGGWQAPTQLDRRDFARPDAPWIVVAFTSATCSTCADVASKAEVLASRDVAVECVDYTERPDLHSRYRIEAVPCLVIADSAGSVHASFVGPVKAQDLWAAVANCREPGSAPPGCTSHGTP